MPMKSIGIDLGKTTFHLVALGNRGQVVARKKFSRQRLTAAINKDGHARIIIMRPETILH